MNARNLCNFMSGRKFQQTSTALVCRRRAKTNFCNVYIAGRKIDKNWKSSKVSRTPALTTVEVSLHGGNFARASTELVFRCFNAIKANDNGFGNLNTQTVRELFRLRNYENKNLLHPIRAAVQLTGTVFGKNHPNGLERNWASAGFRRPVQYIRGGTLGDEIKDCRFSGGGRKRKKTFSKSVGTKEKERKANCVKCLHTTSHNICVEAFRMGTRETFSREKH